MRRDLDRSASDALLRPPIAAINSTTAVSGAMISPKFPRKVRANLPRDYDVLMSQRRRAPCQARQNKKVCDNINRNPCAPEVHLEIRAPLSPQCESRPRR